MLYHLCEGTRAMRSTWDEGKWVDYKKGKFEHHTVGKEASWEVVQGGSEGLLCQDGESEGPQWLTTRRVKRVMRSYRRYRRVRRVQAAVSMVARETLSGSMCITGGPGKVP